jgi:hypothetical protein
MLLGASAPSRGYPYLSTMKAPMTKPPIKSSISRTHWKPGEQQDVAHDAAAKIIERGIILNDDTPDWVLRRIINDSQDRLQDHRKRFLHAISDRTRNQLVPLIRGELRRLREIEESPKKEPPQAEPATEATQRPVTQQDIDDAAALAASQATAPAAEPQPDLWRQVVGIIGMIASAARPAIVDAIGRFAADVGKSAMAHSATPAPVPEPRKKKSGNRVSPSSSRRGPSCAHTSLISPAASPEKSNPPCSSWA